MNDDIILSTAVSPHSFALNFPNGWILSVAWSHRHNCANKWSLQKESNQNKNTILYNAVTCHNMEVSIFKEGCVGRSLHGDLDPDAVEEFATVGWVPVYKLADLINGVKNEKWTEVKEILSKTSDKKDP